MASDTKQPVLPVILILLAVVLFAGLVMFFQSKENKELDTIGLQLCSQNNLSYWYSGGETIHCFRLDESTGIRIAHDFWIDTERAKVVYLTKKPTLRSDLGDLYTTQEGVDVEKGCTKGAGVFNISGERVVCYHCIDKNKSIGQGIPAGGWLCPV